MIWLPASGRQDQLRDWPHKHRARHIVRRSQMPLAPPPLRAPSTPAMGHLSPDANFESDMVSGRRGYSKCRLLTVEH